MTNTIEKDAGAVPELKKKVFRLLGGLALAFGVTLASLFLLAAIVYFSDIREGFIAPIATVLSLLSLFFGARLASGGSRCFWRGVLLGVLYYVILYICALAMFAEFNFSLRTAGFMLIGALIGGIGSMLHGAEAEKKGRRKKKKK